jgi:hypothetical protein
LVDFLFGMGGPMGTGRGPTPNEFRQIYHSITAPEQEFRWVPIHGKSGHYNPRQAGRSPYLVSVS